MRLGHYILLQKEVMIMAMNFSQALKEKTANKGLSPLMQNREKMETIDVLESLTLTMDGCDLVTKDGNEFAVVTFAEFPDNFYFAGKILTDIVKAVYTMEDESGNKMFTEGEPVDLRKYPVPLFAERRKTRDGKKNFTYFEVK
jgi:hypothetical protein